MQDNSQRPHPSITPSLPPPSHYPSIHPPPSPPIYHHPPIRLTSTHSPLFFFLCPAFPFPPSDLVFSHYTSVLRPRHPLANSHFFLPSIHPLFPLHLTCLFSSLLCIITLIRRGACNTAVVYNVSVVITDSLAMLH